MVWCNARWVEEQGSAAVAGLRCQEKVREQRRYQVGVRPTAVAGAPRHQEGGRPIAVAGTRLARSHQLACTAATGWVDE